MRKIDPGEKFDWARLHAQGIGHWVRPEPIEGGTFLQLGDRGPAVEALQGMLQLYGYGVEINGTFDDPTQTMVRAFQRHFRPSRVDGIADSSTVITLHRLLQDQNRPKVFRRRRGRLQSPPRPEGTHGCLNLLSPRNNWPRCKADKHRIRRLEFGFEACSRRLLIEGGIAFEGIDLGCDLEFEVHARPRL